VIELRAEEREELTRWSKSRTLPAGDVLKARLILAMADGKSCSTVEAELNTSRPTVGGSARGTSPDGTTVLLPYSEDQDAEFYERLSEEELEARLHIKRV
jgi:hypothetical protein